MDSTHRRRSCATESGRARPGTDKVKPGIWRRRIPRARMCRSSLAVTSASTKAFAIGRKVVRLRPWIRRTVSACSRSSKPREAEREHLVLVGHPVDELQPGRCEVAGDPRGRELRADLGAQLLALCEVHGQIEIGEV